MKQFIAPQMLRVTGKPSPCKCTNEPDRKIICAYCVQANLILWQRNNDPDKLLNETLSLIRKIGVRRSASILSERVSTVHSWLRRNAIPGRKLPSVRMRIRTYADG